MPKVNKNKMFYELMYSQKKIFFTFIQPTNDERHQRSLGQHKCAKITKNKSKGTSYRTKFQANCKL